MRDARDHDQVQVLVLGHVAAAGGKSRPLDKRRVVREVSGNMSSHKPAEQSEGTALGTLGWVGVVLVLAVVALLVLSALGPVGEH